MVVSLNVSLFVIDYENIRLVVAAADSPPRLVRCKLLMIGYPNRLC
jgi:hypothetical protein